MTLREILYLEEFHRWKELLAQEGLGEKAENLKKMKKDLGERAEDTLLGLLKLPKKESAEIIQVTNTEGLYTIRKVNLFYKDKEEGEEYDAVKHEPVFSLGLTDWSYVMDAEIKLTNLEEPTPNGWMKIGMAIIDEMTHFGHTEEQIEKEKDQIKKIVSLNNESA